MITDLTRKKFDELATLVRRKSSRGRWLVLTHDNPDPDSIAAAAALSKLLRKSFRRRVTIAYGSTTSTMPWSTPSRGPATTSCRNV